MSLDPEHLDQKPIVIHVTPPARSPQEEKEIRTADLAKSTLFKGLESATSVAEFSWYYRAIRVFDQHGLIWVRASSTEISTDSVIATYLTKRERSEAQLDEEFMKDVAPSLQDLENDPVSIKIGIRRIRDKHRYYSYRVLAQFPSGILSNSPVLGYADTDYLAEHPDTVLFQPSNVCTAHACDDIFKSIRQAPAYIPFKTRKEAIDALQRDDHGINEYQLKKDASGIIKQDAANYITVAIQSAFSNEPYVIPVSRFPLSLSRFKQG